MSIIIFLPPLLVVLSSLSPFFSPSSLPSTSRIEVKAICGSSRIGVVTLKLSLCCGGVAGGG
jgi:hypothetical protein